VDDEVSAADKPQPVTVVYRKPVVRLGTPEARAQGGLCRFESNMQAGFLTADGCSIRHCGSGSCCSKRFRYTSRL
jgi:hypothetical protein